MKPSWFCYFLIKEQPQKHLNIGNKEQKQHHEARRGGATGSCLRIVGVEQLKKIVSFSTCNFM